MQWSFSERFALCWQTYTFVFGFSLYDSCCRSFINWRRRRWWDDGSSLSNVLWDGSQEVKDRASQFCCLCVGAANTKTRRAMDIARAAYSIWRAAYSIWRAAYSKTRAKRASRLFNLQGRLFRTEARCAKSQRRCCMMLAAARPKPIIVVVVLTTCARFSMNWTKSQVDKDLVLSSLENALNSLAKWIEAHGQPLVVAPHNLQAGSAGVMQQPCCPSMAAKEIAVDRRKHPTDCCSQDVNACNGGACWKVSSSSLCYFFD